MSSKGTIVTYKIRNKEAIIDNDVDETNSLLHNNQLDEYKMIFNDHGNNSYQLLKKITLLLSLCFICILLFLNIFNYQNDHAHYHRHHLIVKSENECIQKYGYNHYHCMNTSSNYTILQNNTNQTIYRIILHGDSLVTKPNRMYNLSNNIIIKLQLTFPTLLFNIIVSATNIDGIHDIIQTINQSCLVYQPHSIILLWDSDKTRFYSKDSKDIQIYQDYLNILINLLKNKIKNIAIAGPGLYGELPNGQNTVDRYLNKYQYINNKVANIQNISYLDIRKALFKAERNNHGKYYYSHGSHGQYGYLTIDGLHPSVIGSTIIEEMICNQLITWYSHNI